MHRLGLSETLWSYRCEAVEKWIYFLETIPCRDISGDKPDNPVIRSGEKPALMSLPWLLTHTPVTHTGKFFFHINWMMVRCCEKGDWTLCHRETGNYVYVTRGVFGYFYQSISSCQICLHFFKGKCKSWDTDIENTFMGINIPSCL